jgi:hypothetical protein
VRAAGGGHGGGDGNSRGRRGGRKGGEAGDASPGRRWATPGGRRGRSWLPLVVLSCALGLGLYWAATQAGWLAVGWRPALATTLLYLAGVAAVSGPAGSATAGRTPSTEER